MIDLYTFATPNGRKASIMLEETALPYSTHVIHIGKGEQFAPEFVAINPNSKIPAIVDPDGPGGAPISVFESGAILFYLAEKTGRFMPADARGRTFVMEWLMFQMAGVGPMFGQASHFVKFAPEDVPYAKQRYLKEMHRLLAVMDRRLGTADYLAGDYSIADMATYPWVFSAANFIGEDLSPYANVLRWQEAVGSRPAVAKGMAVPQV
ncbi:MAG: glutathione S-transferase N-terminal domain-containing protein [Rhodospirillaceae bacterium]|nr:glutathione S-transferase N-terminal domain-containing protein [Rhodospirillaceae bacterium]